MVIVKWLGQQWSFNYYDPSLLSLDLCFILNYQWFVGFVIIFFFHEQTGEVVKCKVCTVYIKLALFLIN